MIEEKNAGMTPPQDKRPAAWRRMSKLALLTSVVVGLGFVAVVVLFVYQSHTGFQRFLCSENLKNIGHTAYLHNEYDGGFPVTMQTGSEPPVGWRVQLWSKVETDKLAKYDFVAPYDSPQNLEVAAKITAFQCPLSNTRAGHTSYFAVFSAAEDKHQTCFVVNQTLRIDDISDGISNTIFAIEASRHSPQSIWNGPDDLQWSKMDFTVNNEQQRPGIASLHDGFWQPRSAPVVAVGGAVIFLSNEVDPAIVRKLLLRNDAQDVEFPRSR